MRWGLGPRAVATARACGARCALAGESCVRTVSAHEAAVCGDARPGFRVTDTAGAQRQRRPHRGKHVLPRGAQVLQAGAHAGRRRSLQRADVYLRQVALEQRRIHGAQVLCHTVQQVQHRQLALRPRLWARKQRVSTLRPSKTPACRRTATLRRRKSQRNAADTFTHAHAARQRAGRGGGGATPVESASRWLQRRWQRPPARAPLQSRRR